MRHLLSPFYRQGNWGTEKLRNILRVTDLISSGSECCTQAAWLENLHFEIGNVSMGLSYVWNNFLYRAIYSNFGWMSWTQSPDVLLGFHSSLKRWCGFFFPRFSEGGIQIHKNRHNQDFHELHSDSPALLIFPHFWLVFTASSLWSPAAPQRVPVCRNKDSGQPKINK